MGDELNQISESIVYIAALVAVIGIIALIVAVRYGGDDDDDGE